MWLYSFLDKCTRRNTNEQTCTSTQTFSWKQRDKHRQLLRQCSKYQCVFVKVSSPLFLCTSTERLHRKERADRTREQESMGNKRWKEGRWQNENWRLLINGELWMNIWFSLLCCFLIWNHTVYFYLVLGESRVGVKCWISRWSIKASSCQCYGALWSFILNAWFH